MAKSPARPGGTTKRRGRGQDRIGIEGEVPRLAFVLCDLCDLCAMPFGEMGRMLGQSTDATKMVAGRARRRAQASSGRRLAEGSGERWSRRP